jgi:hypothetical protein
MSALGLGCVKTRRRATAIEWTSPKSNSGAQRFVRAFSIDRLKKNYSCRFLAFCVFTQPRSQAAVWTPVHRVRFTPQSRPIRCRRQAPLLIHKRRLTPSCGGRAPTAERTVGPARMIVESLTPRPGIREHNRPTADHSRLTPAEEMWHAHSPAAPLARQTSM